MEGTRGKPKKRKRVLLYCTCFFLKKIEIFLIGIEPGTSSSKRFFFKIKKVTIALFLSYKRYLSGGYTSAY